MTFCFSHGVIDWQTLTLIVGGVGLKCREWSGEMLQEERPSSSVVLRPDCMVCYSHASVNESAAASLTSAKLHPQGPKHRSVRDEEKGLDSTAK